MAQIQGARSGNELEVAESGAAYAQLLGPDGNPIGVDGKPLVVTGSLTVDFPDVQQIAGSVDVEFPDDQAIHGTVVVANPVESVEVENWPADQQIHGTVAVSNPTTSVAVNNLPATQQIAGSVSVSNLPADQKVSGSVAVTNPVTSVAVNNLPATQQVAGTVGADNRVAGAPVSSSNRLPVETTGTVAVSNHPSTAGADLRVGGSAVTSGNRVPVETTGTVAVSNPTTSVAVNNLPAEQTVKGSVAVNNLPATQQVAGSVSVSNLPGTQNVAGTVAVSNPVTSVTVAGQVDAVLRTGPGPVSSGNPVPTVVIEPTDAAAEFTSMIDVVPAAALADGATLWVLRNPTSKAIGIRRLDLQQGFSGTAAASRSAYVVQRFSGTAPAGGTAVVPSKKVSSSVETIASVLQGTAALTVTGTTFGAIVHKVASANQLAATTTQDLVFSGGPLVLGQNEGIAIRASGAVVLGSFLVGSIGWYEL